jgi:adenosylcobinamide-phosphate synthase
VALVLAWFVIGVLGWFGPPGWLGEGFIVFALLAQKNLKDHVGAVAKGLKQEGIAGGRQAVSRIVGRDPAKLDPSGVARAAVESLAENFSDGVVAPAFWYAVFGLPGLFVYKMINTADSMIGHRNERYLEFGRVAAQADDLANWLPARLSTFIIAAAAWTIAGASAARRAVATAFGDAGLHRSPNAGWPESAFAGALGIALGGPRVYRDETVAQAYLNSAGLLELDAADIDRALVLFSRSCFALWALVALAVLLA